MKARSIVFVLICVAVGLVNPSPGAAKPSKSEGQMDDQIDLILRLGFGGQFKYKAGSATAGFQNADATVGFTFRWQRAAHRYVTAGFGFSFYSVEPRFGGRDPWLDFAGLVKGRYPFRVGKKKQYCEGYTLFQVGFTAGFDPQLAKSFGPGWNIGFTPGFVWYFKPNIGVMNELGWIRDEASFDTGGGSRTRVIVQQAAYRFGIVFRL